jgi:succinate-acetate transporter protein
MRIKIFWNVILNTEVSEELGTFIFRGHEAQEDFESQKICIMIYFLYFIFPLTIRFCTVKAKKSLEQVLIAGLY